MSFDFHIVTVHAYCSPDTPASIGYCHTGYASRFLSNAQALGMRRLGHDDFLIVQTDRRNALVAVFDASDLGRHHPEDDGLIAEALGMKWNPPSSPAPESHRLEHSTEVVVGVHSPDKCSGRPCSIHNMTDHPMRSFPQHWRGDRGLMERICPHGVGHPDPDGFGDGVHGCDGCCSSSPTPGPTAVDGMSGDPMFADLMQALMDSMEPVQATSSPAPGPTAMDPGGSEGMVTDPPAVTIPEDQRFIVFPADPDTQYDWHGWEWMDNGPDDPVWTNYEPGWRPLICRLVTADEWDAITARLARLDAIDPDMPDHLTDAEQWALDELADLSIDYPAVVQAAADRLIPTATVRPEARARFLAAADRALAVRRADLGPLPIVLAAVRKRAGISVDAIQETVDEAGEQIQVTDLEAGRITLRDAGKKVLAARVAYLLNTYGLDGDA